MKYTFFYVSAGLTAGILLQKFCGFPNLWAWQGFLSALVPLWYFRNRRPFLPLLVVCLACLGVLRMQMVESRPSEALEKFASGNRAALSGVVKTQPEIKIKGKKETISFVLSAKKVKHSDVAFNVRGDAQVFLFNPGKIPDVGDVVRIYGTLGHPKHPQNPGEFDYGQYLAQRGIYSVVMSYGRRSFSIKGKDKSYRIRMFVERARSRLERRIENLFGKNYEKDEVLRKRQVVPALKALIIGKRKELDYDLRDAFMMTGTAHLLAISGLHVTLVAGTFYALMIFLSFPQRVSALLSILLIGAYVFIAGSAVSIQRAGIMAGAVFLAVALERNHHFMNLFFLAFFLLLWRDPKNLTSLSFQLSFLSVFSLIYFIPGAMEHWRWKESIGRTGAILVGTVPLVLYYFNIFSPVSLVGNFIAIPLFHVSLLSAFVSLVIGNLPLIGAAAIESARFFTECALAWILMLGEQKWGYYFFRSPSLLIMAAYYAGLGLFLLTIRRPEKIWKSLRPWCGGAVTAFAFAMFVPTAFGRDVQITMLAAGKNELLHIKTVSNHHWLINAGREYPSDQGRWTLVPYLKHLGINRIQGVFLTDSYKKHTGGLNSLKRHMRIGALYYPDFLNTERRLDALGSKPFKTSKIGAKKQMEIGPESRVRVLGISGGQAVMMFEVGLWRFLLLPSLHEELVKIVGDSAELVRNTNVILLPSIRKNEISKAVYQIERLMTWVDPDVVAMPHSVSDIQSFLRERDIAYYDSSRLGAVTFSIHGVDAKTNIQKQKGSLLIVDSFLQGPLLELPQFVY